MSATKPALVGCTRKVLESISHYIGRKIADIDATKSLSAHGLNNKEDLNGLAQELEDVVAAYYHGPYPSVDRTELSDGDIVINDLLLLMFVKCGLMTKPEAKKYATPDLDALVEDAKENHP